MSRNARTKVVEVDPKKEVTAASAAHAVKGAPARTTDKPDPRAPAIPAPQDPSGDAPPNYPPAQMAPAIPTRPADPEARPTFAPDVTPAAIPPKED